VVAVMAIVRWRPQSRPRLRVTCRHPLPSLITVAAATTTLAPTTERPAMLLPPRRWWLMLPVYATSFAIHLSTGV